MAIKSLSGAAVGCPAATNHQNWTGINFAQLCGSAKFNSARKLPPALCLVSFSLSTQQGRLFLNPFFSEFKTWILFYKRILCVTHVQGIFRKRPRVTSMSSYLIPPPPFTRSMRLPPSLSFSLSTLCIADTCTTHPVAKKEIQIKRQQKGVLIFPLFVLGTLHITVILNSLSNSVPMD